MTSVPKAPASTTSWRWFVVQAQAHSEIKASQHLKRQGFETYVSESGDHRVTRTAVAWKFSNPRSSTKIEANCAR
jgi:hypothetical protein